MSDDRNDEAAGLGAADPITGITAAKDDLDRDAVLPDDDGGFDDAGSADSLVTNDAVAGETVEPGIGDGNDGPTGGAPAELTPDADVPHHGTDPATIDLDDER